MTKTFQILSIQDTPALSSNRLDILFDKKIHEEIKKHILYQALNQFVLTSFYQFVFQGHHQDFNPTKAKIQNFNRSLKLFPINVACKPYAFIALRHCKKAFTFWIF